MPILPSGRRIEFSLDRFHDLLGRMSAQAARRLASKLSEPDDLLHVLDAVHFSLRDDSPYFAGYVVADWSAYAADWPAADRQVLQSWLALESTRAVWAEAIEYIRSLYLHTAGMGACYPYQLVGANRQAVMVTGGRSLH